MVRQGEPGIDPAGLVVPLAGRLVATGDRWQPYRLVDAGGTAVDSVAVYFGHLQAAGRAELTVRSYGMDLLRWWRPINCTMSLIFSQADRLVSQRSMVWSRTYDVP